MWFFGTIKRTCRDDAWNWKVLWRTLEWRYLIGCILPWKNLDWNISQMTVLKNNEDSRKTSCFVIKWTPGENIVAELWRKHKKLSFASSANPSGKGNRGLVSGIGERIESEADLIIEANDYVNSIQPSEQIVNRYEQGVMSLYGWSKW